MWAPSLACMREKAHKQWQKQSPIFQSVAHTVHLMSHRDTCLCVICLYFIICNHVSGMNLSMETSLGPPLFS